MIGRPSWRLMTRAMTTATPRASSAAISGVAQELALGGADRRSRQGDDEVALGVGDSEKLGDGTVTVADHDVVALVGDAAAEGVDDDRGQLGLRRGDDLALESERDLGLRRALDELRRRRRRPDGRAGCVPTYLVAGPRRSRSAPRRASRCRPCSSRTGCSATPFSANRAHRLAENEPVDSLGRRDRPAVRVEDHDQRDAREPLRRLITLCVAASPRRRRPPARPTSGDP